MQSPNMCLLTSIMEKGSLSQVFNILINIQYELLMTHKRFFMLPPICHGKQESDLPRMQQEE